MNKQEALAFLNIAPDTGDAEISRVFSEKYNHFQFLLTHAPNELLRNIHQKNLDQLEAVKQALGIYGSERLQDNTLKVPASEHESLSHTSHSPKESGTSGPVAWLIRHTENKSHAYHAIWPGEIAVGRTAVVNRRSICIEDDPFVSRYHATIHVSPGPAGYIFEIFDDGRFNQGMASKNGVYINASEKRLGSSDSRVLKDGDTIQIGNTKFMFRVNSESKTISGLVKEVEKTQFVKTVVIDL